MKIEPNNIYYGDCYELIKEVPNKSIDLIITDPPYEIGDVGRNTSFFKNRKDGYKQEIQKNNLSNGFDLKILDDFVRVMKKINIYIWCNKEQIYDYLTYFVKGKKCNWEMFVWAKDNPPPFLNGHYLKDKEYCLYFWEQGVKVQPTYELGKTVMISSINVADKKDYGHPTIKPIEFIEKFILNSSKEDDIIFDPFAGSFTTCVAAKRLGRRYIGFEINEKWFNVGKARLEGFNQKGEMNLFDIDYD